MLTAAATRWLKVEMAEGGQDLLALEMKMWVACWAKQTVSESSTSAVSIALSGNVPHVFGGRRPASSRRSTSSLPEVGPPNRPGNTTSDFGVKAGGGTGGRDAVSADSQDGPHPGRSGCLWPLPLA